MSENTEQYKNIAPVKEAVKDKHPLGAKIKIKAHALSAVDKKSQIFVSINKYTVEFQQNKEVLVREKFVDFLETATKPLHTIDEKGDPVTESEPLYAVSRLK
jgi:hypothetical protein